ARLHIQSALAHALQYLYEVIKHVVDRVHHVAQRVIGDAPAQRQVAPGYLAHNGQELRHALLQLLLRFLVEDHARGSFSGAIEILGNEAEIIARVDRGPGPIVAVGEALSKVHKMPDWIQHLVAKHEKVEDQRAEAKHARDDQLAAVVSDVSGVGDADAPGVLPSAVGKVHHQSQRQGIHAHDHPYGRI